MPAPRAATAQGPFPTQLLAGPPFNLHLGLGRENWKFFEF